MEDRDFLNSPPLKTVRFGGSVVETLAKYKRVSDTFQLSVAFEMPLFPYMMILSVGIRA